MLYHVTYRSFPYSVQFHWALPTVGGTPFPLIDAFVADGSLDLHLCSTETFSLEKASVHCVSNRFLFIYFLSKSIC